MRKRIPFLTLSLLLLLTVRATAQDDPAAEFYALINQARLEHEEELAPYGWSDELSAAARRHANDLAAGNTDSHIGSDGSTARQRIAQSGYGAWSDGAVVGENFYMGISSVQDAFDWFMDDPPHRENILNARFREVGIAVATGANGRNYYVLDFGARPNVLPIFINDGAATTESPQIAIRLSNEEANPQGQGALYIGRAIEIRIGDTRDLENQSWQNWEPLVAWTLPDTPGEHTVYVQFRDGAGRTTTSADSIVLRPGEGTALPTATPEPVVAPDETVIPEPVAPEATAPVETPVAPEPILSPTAALAEVTPIAFPTWTPLPTGVAADVTVQRAASPLTLLCALHALALLLLAATALRRRSG